MQFVHRFFLFTLQKCLQFNSIVAKNDSLLSFTLAHIIANSSDFIFRAFFSSGFNEKGPTHKITSKCIV